MLAVLVLVVIVYNASGSARPVAGPWPPFILLDASILQAARDFFYRKY